MTDDNKKLYPLRFIDEGENTSWGHISYHIADLGFKDSMVDNGWFGGNTLSELMNTYLERVVGDDVFEYYGLQFPLMIKVIQTVSRQPLQVNASDEVAEERYDTYGKTALWYIESAEKDSVLYLGFNKDVEAEDFYRKCNDGSLENILNAVHPKAGEAYVINPGTVFCAGKGLKIVEIAEPSELAFNIHDWGTELPESEELLLEEAFDMIDFKATKPEALTAEKLIELPEFIVTKFSLEKALHIYSEEPGSFAAYYCVSGEASIQVTDESDEKPSVNILKAGHTLLVPSELNDYILAPLARQTVVLEAIVGKRLVKDLYTNESVEPNMMSEDLPDPHVKDYN